VGSVRGARPIEGTRLGSTHLDRPRHARAFRDDELVPFPERVAERYHAWLLQQENQGREFTPEQLAWLERIRDTIASSLGITREDLMGPPFAERGGLGKATELFGDRLDPLLKDLAEVLTA
jgi:type I restriction enzyme R subunit